MGYTKIKGLFYSINADTATMEKKSIDFGDPPYYIPQHVTAITIIGNY